MNETTSPEQARSGSLPEFQSAGGAKAYVWALYLLGFTAPFVLPVAVWMGPGKFPPFVTGLVVAYIVLMVPAILVVRFAPDPREARRWNAREVLEGAIAKLGADRRRYVRLYYVAVAGLALTAAALAARAAMLVVTGS